MRAADAPGCAYAGGPPAQVRHGAVPRGQDLDTADAASPGRFAKLFACLEPAELCEETLDDIVDLLGIFSKGSSDRSEIHAVVAEGHGDFPAGFTYFGQFVDHDITFDPTPSTQRIHDPHAHRDFRTPRFDLDSLYGTGPDDQPYLYDRGYEVAGTKLLVDPIRGSALGDLPRNCQGIALIGDPRNDEHRIISQLHLLFIHFHNVVVDYLHDCVRVSDEKLFATARDTVRWHYQWIVIHEFLRLVVGKDMADSVFVPSQPGQPPAVRLEYYRPEGRPFMPYEFSVAAFRFGHSMVRARYRINDVVDALPIIEEVPGELSLSGESRLTEDLVIEWKRFFALPREYGDAQLLQMALHINATISSPLFTLPHRGSLPRLNLQRGRRVGLPSGQQVAAAMGLRELSDEALHVAAFQNATTRDHIKKAAPLWYYLLCEAAVRPAYGARLGAVGGKIVAEVLVGLLVGDPESYYRRCPTWTPHLGPTPHDFTMAELVLIARRDIEPGSVRDYPGARP
jgi:hypothetical protein